jgi:hypothetical protein
MIHVEPDYEVWKQYAYEQSIHPAIISYLNARPESFCRIETTVDGRLFATPRGWEDLSRLIEVYEKLGKKTDREVIGQYLQFPKIARDFANYLELYYKYQDDYQIDEILSGSVRETLSNKLKRAQFDEKLNVIGLLLSKLNGGFKQVVRDAEKLEILMAELKKLHDGSLSGDMEARLCTVRKEFKQAWEKKRQAGLLNRQSDYLHRDVEHLLEQYEKEIHFAETPDPEAAWETVKSYFGREREVYETQFDESGAMLEHAFDFMEITFGDSQEMAVFITELNTNYYSIKFLQEYECGRYYQYNERLLFNRREDEIKERIDHLGR